MPFMIDTVHRKVVITVKQEIPFVEILDSYAWQKYGKGVDHMSSAIAQNELDIITRFSREYTRNTDFDYSLNAVDDSVSEILFMEDVQAAKDRRKASGTTAEVAKPLVKTEKPPKVVVVEEPEDFELEEPATPEEVQEVKNEN